MNLNSKIQLNESVEKILESGNMFLTNKDEKIELSSVEQMIINHHDNLNLGDIKTFLNYIGKPVTLYGRENSRNLQQLKETRKNDYLELPERVLLSNDLAVAQEADVIFISIKSQELENLCTRLNEYDVSKKTIVLCMKGIEVSSGRRLSQIVADTIKQDINIGVWVGPGHVQEFTRGVPNCMVIDSSSRSVTEYLVKELSSDLIRFYYGDDLIGNELGAAVKNVIGIAAGMLDGIGYEALKGALISRGTREVYKMIEKLGGHGISAYGLCHLGDYEATVFSKFSNNRAYGENFILGNDIMKLAEGVETVKAVHLLCDQNDIDMPICNSVYRIIYEKVDPKEELVSLFTRSLKKEFF